MISQGLKFYFIVEMLDHNTVDPRYLDFGFLE